MNKKKKIPSGVLLIQELFGHSGKFCYRAAGCGFTGGSHTNPK